MHESDEILYHRYLSRGSEDDLRLLLERHRESLTLFIYNGSPVKTTKRKNIVNHSVSGHRIDFAADGRA